MKRQTYEAYLAEHGEMTYSTVGVSMLPLLRAGRDLFTVKRKGAARCSKYDVVLYRRNPSQYVLHRIIAVRGGDYVLLGDNCIRKEYGITDADIIGVMTAVIREGKTIPVTDPRYRLYVRIRCAAYPLRILRHRLKGLLHACTGRRNEP